MSEPPTKATLLLQRLSHGEEAAAGELFPLLYDELHQLAVQYMQGERRSTLQPTALVHEAYLKLVGQKKLRWESRVHFFRIAAKAMREVLVDHARARNRAKRNAEGARLPLDDVMAFFGAKTPHLLVLDGALDQLFAMDANLARIVELRFFGGLTTEETARVLSQSTRTVERGWRMARAWLRERIASADAPRAP